jgi:hypothetical protein
MGKDHGDGPWGGPIYSSTHILIYALFNFPEYDNFQ